MSRPKHRVHAAGAYFITAETWQRRKLFVKNRLTEILIETMLNYRNQGHYQLHDFVVMPEHFHLLLTPGGDSSLEKAVQMIKGGSSFQIGRLLQKKLPVWQPGFHEHWIRSRADYDRCREYILSNPVKAGLVERPEDYLYSSIHGKFVLDSYPSGAKAPKENAGVTAGLKPRPAKPVRSTD